MRSSIFFKLFISFLAISLMLVVGMTLFVSYNFKTGFNDYFNQIEQQQATKIAAKLAPYYSYKSGWDKLTQNPEIFNRTFADLSIPPPPPVKPFGPKPASQLPKQEDKYNLLPPLSHRINFVDLHKQPILPMRPLIRNSDIWVLKDIPVMVDGEVKAWLVLSQKTYLEGAIIERFYEQQQGNLFWWLAFAGLVSFGIAFFMVRRLFSPLKQLIEGANTLAKGQYDVKFCHQSKDEFSDLSYSLQSLAQSLAKNQQQRQQWISDISHELRTPVAVMRSELEAIQDGIREPKPENIDSMHQQVLGLTRLIDDLYQLSKQDTATYQLNLTQVDLVNLIKDIALSFEARMKEAGLDICLDFSSKSQMITADPQMLGILISNLLENSLRYTDAPGQIKVSLNGSSGVVILTIEDSSPSVAPIHLPKLFDRLYRVDKSRSRQYGGSGLGLSICKNIVQMHHGEISAWPSKIGGVAVRVSLKKGYK